jgi:hypothetical protein
MPCTKGDCNQGRDCDCSRSGDKAVVVTVLFFVLLSALAYGIFELVNNTKGSPCSVEVQFKDSKATYIGTTV